jgi:glycosyltransferase involved in cell wall biosynthesis
LAAYLARVPHRVFTSHGWAFAAADGRSERLYRTVERMLNPVTSAVICVSEREHARGIEAGACATARAYVIPNAVDTERFGPGSDMRDAATVEVVSVGRLAAPKDFSTLVAAVGELPRGMVTLRIVGDGPARTSLEDLVARLGLADCVRFDGTVSDIAPILAESDIFVLSSRSEGMPMSVLEAMATGLPVVATDVGGLRELVDDENGRIVPPGDRVAMAAMIAELAADGSLRRRLGAAGRQRAVTRFSLPAWRDRHRELYARLIHGLSGGHVGQPA